MRPRLYRYKILLCVTQPYPATLGQEDFLRPLPMSDHALPVHQLCHLISVAEALGGRDGYPGFFYNEAAARGAGYRALL